MVLRFFILVGTFLLVSCAEPERDNPDDTESINYRSPSSSSVANSSSSVPIQTGIIYGDPVTYRGETYQTVIIGTQTWMARNLNYNVSGSKCYSNSEANCTKYGRLYNWTTAVAGICPSGWRIPSYTDFQTLKNYVEKQKSCTNCAGKILKAKSSWNNNGNGNDAFGFSALPGGFVNLNGEFVDVGYQGIWWTTWEKDADNTNVLSMLYNRDSLNWYYSSKTIYYHSVRCLKGMPLPSSSSSTQQSSSSSFDPGSSSTDISSSSETSSDSSSVDPSSSSTDISSSNSTPSSSSSVPPSSSSVAKSSSSAVVSSSSSKPSSSSVSCTAANNTSTQYCSNGTMKTYGSVTDDGGQTYKTVVIGTQTWMAENLNYNVNGSKCGNGSTLTDANTITCNTYGRLYDWATAMNCKNTISCSVGTKHRGICPSGWHIPSDAEWTTLTNFVGGPLTASRYLKATSGWDNNGNGSDTYGFLALPGGYGSSSDGNSYVGSRGYWWGCSSESVVGSTHRYMTSVSDYVGKEDYHYSDSYLHSVRCVKD